MHHYPGCLASQSRPCQLCWSPVPNEVQEQYGCSFKLQEQLSILPKSKDLLNCPFFGVTGCLENLYYDQRASASSINLGNVAFRL
jgi:hypothetical protein